MKEKSKEKIHGIPQFSYKLLSWLCDFLLEINPGSIVEFRSDKDHNFLKLFVAYAVSICGLKMACRPIVVIDSLHISSSCKGALFSASSFSVDDRLFPVAYGLFSSKNYEE